MNIYIFRRDLRLADNLGFLQACTDSETLLPIFILDENILSRSPKNDLRLGFLCDALLQLQSELQKKNSDLFVFHGTPEKIVAHLLQQYPQANIFANKSLGTYGNKRDKKIKEICTKNGTEFFVEDDSLLVPIDAVPVRKVFSAFYRKWAEIDKKKPQQAPKKIPDLPSALPNNTVPIDEMRKKINAGENKYWPVDMVFSRLRTMDLAAYPDKRNAVDEDGTTRLSPYLRFGIVSCREAFSHIASCPFDTSVLQKELAWREFWTHILYHFPRTKEEAFQEKRRGIAWKKDKKKLQAWKDGKTGYPVIDAAMRQLNQENWMHNRARMFVASFLTKDLLIDWREGEKYFSEKLLDYDEAVNIGNWQWSASVGADPKPMRIFSPLLQAERFDPKAKYIKKYIPELEHHSPQYLHNPLKYSLDYISPIVDHAVAQREAKQAYNAAFSTAL